MSRQLKGIDLEKIELFLFDLDGTLYEDQAHFDYYADCLARSLSFHRQELFWRDLISARRGEHVLRLGRVYDLKKDLVLEVDSRAFVKKAWTWDGKTIKEEELKALYPGPAFCNMENMLYMGDGWWLPAACAFHYGLENPGHCYQKTKELLLENDHALQPVPGLEKKLRFLKESFPLILATNSEEEDTGRLLEVLGLENIFKAIYTCCEKPARTPTLVGMVEKDFAINREGFLSIGDNFLNEIAPLRQRGAQTVLIDPHDVFQENEETGPVVESIREIFPLFDALIEG